MGRGRAVERASVAPKQLPTHTPPASHYTSHLMVSLAAVTSAAPSTFSTRSGAGQDNVVAAAFISCIAATRSSPLYPTAAEDGRARCGGRGGGRAVQWGGGDGKGVLASLLPARPTPSPLEPPSPPDHRTSQHKAPQLSFVELQHMLDVAVLILHLGTRHRPDHVVQLKAGFLPAAAAAMEWVRMGSAGALAAVRKAEPGRAVAGG